MSNVKDLVMPGDLLLYSGTSLMSKIIKIKSWSDVSHTEIFYTFYPGGLGKTMTSNPSRGVDLYDFQDTNLYKILRPQVESLNLQEMRYYVTRYYGQKYDWIGLLSFFRIGKETTNKQFCSELCTRLYRIGGFEPFVDKIRADKVSPGNFLYSPKFTEIWSKE